jgi:hypothetical protein
LEPFFPRSAGRGRWTLDECLCGIEWLARFRGRDTVTGKRILAIVTPAQIRPHEETLRALEYPHPKVAPLLFVGPVDRGAPDILIEVEPEGVPLVEARGSMSRRGRLRLLLELGSVVADAHASARVFGFLRPELVYVQGSEESPLTGIAPRCESFMQTAGPGETAPMLFEYFYTAFEGLKGQPTNPEADVYTLSAIAYWLLVGEHPLEGSYMENGWAVVYERRRPAPAGVSIPAVVDAGLAKEIADRPSLDEWLAEIGRHL